MDCTVQQGATGILPVHRRDASGTRPWRLFLVPLGLRAAKPFLA